MAKLTREKLNKILEEHKHWIDKDCKNWEEMRANLLNADLRCADLRNAVLYNADLSDADLSGAYLLNTDLRNAVLSGANLRNANLRGAYLLNTDLRNAVLYNADLSDADLSGADLRSTDLRNAVLSGANLRNVNLRSAYLLNADLSGADFRGTNLHNADLSGADLHNADLRGANLCGADLRGAKNVPYIPMVCPEEGDFIGWKKAEGNKDKVNVIVKLRIPSDAKRSSATTRKCRCSKAEVIAIYNLDGTEAGETTCHSDYDHSFIYEIGKTVEVTDFSEDRWSECAKGIHFFISRQEAIDY